MEHPRIPENPYLLLTPGPLTTTPTVKAAMLQDWCTWDRDYNGIVQGIRERLVKLATTSAGYTCTLMQGSGTFSVESVIGTAIPENGTLLVLVNGAYGNRMVQIAGRLGIPVQVLDSGEVAPPDLSLLESILRSDTSVTHVAVVHCETTTGMLNPVETIGRLVKSMGRIYIVDAMSSFGGIPMDIHAMGADYLISSANKCIQGVPGFGFVIARRDEMERIGGQARSVSLDLHDQWKTMEDQSGKWRFTSPTHVVRAFAQALLELEEEGGVQKRWERYRENQTILVEGMEALGFRCLLPKSLQSPVITAFHNPENPEFHFHRFYEALKAKGFVIYPGKVTSKETFRMGNIGDIHRADILRLLEAVRDSMFWTGRP
ncbi:MAG: 2-aminoethylphosphonate--pyruvate transaminase [Deltaproteobacteria bacterium]|nr:2-aminoethylphosphonate--pyruvate transaminase [Deltaproteobacteria bacterium]